MINCSTVKLTMGIALFLCLSAISFGQDCFDYNNSKDSLKGKITIDNKLYSEFFDSHETSYPWYIFHRKDGTFETALDREITEEDKIPIEHTSNCVSTHQGNHKMDFCDAVMEADGSLKLYIYGGMPAYSSSLMITIKDSEFFCYFRAAYPAPVFNCNWNILSKTLKLKSPGINKGGRIFAWLSVVIEETSTYKDKTTTNKYKIEGYLKPIVK